MARSHSWSVFMMLLLFLMNSSTLFGSAREFKVGGNLGWLEPATTNATFYNQWAEAHRFRVGDSLVFKYNNDSVVVVEKWGYYHCDTSRPIVVLNDGNSTVRLDRAGLFYFVSASPNHCKHGQRMIVDVMTPRALSPFAGSPSPAHSSATVLAPVAHAFLLVAALVFHVYLISY